MIDWIRSLFEVPGMDGMGHGQNPDEADLGLGWIYYGLARAMRPQQVVVIGSYRGYVPAVIAKAMTDSGSGRLLFLDPSMVDDFWTDEEKTLDHFAKLEIRNIEHVRLTTQEFVATEKFRAIPKVDLLFVDGFHSAEQAKFDHEAFLPLMNYSSLALFHDSVRHRTSRIYGPDKPYEHTVCQYMDELRRQPQFEVLSFSQADGLTLVRRIGE